MISRAEAVDITKHDFNDAIGKHISYYIHDGDLPAEDLFSGKFDNEFTPSDRNLLVQIKKNHLDSL